MNVTGTDSARDALLAALAWQIELGADECIGEAPVDRFAEKAPPPASPPPATLRVATPTAKAVRPPPDDSPDAAQTTVLTTARAAARAAATLEALRDAMIAFDGSPLKQGARNTVFADGNPAARVMFIGEAPGREEDRQGKPFVGRSGQLLDRMLAAIGLDRNAEAPDRAAYIANVLPWRPLGDRDPSTDEAALLWAFLERHIELAAPEFIVALGRAPAAALMDSPVRITRERGRWVSLPRAGGRPLLLTLHPAYLLRQPAEKAKSWRDLLMLRAALDGEKPEVEG